MNEYPACVVVFDSYPEEPTTKVAAHRNWIPNSVVGPHVQDSRISRFAVTKENFLSNNANKQRFINLLSDKLDKKDINGFYTKDDADTLIATTAINAAESSEVIVVCNDTDIIVLL